MYINFGIEELKKVTVSQWSDLQQKSKVYFTQKTRKNENKQKNKHKKPRKIRFNISEWIISKLKLL